MKCVLSLWLLHVVYCQLPVTSGSDVFLAKVVSSRGVCDRLCVYTSRCHAYRWEAATRTCHLSTQAASTDTDFTDAKHHNGQCGQRPCAPMETCIPVEAATAYICLKTTLPTSPTASSTPTTTSVPAWTTTTHPAPGVTTTSVPSSTVTPAACVSNCTGLGDGKYQLCERCDGYLECSNGQTFNRSCGLGTVWDDNTKSCRFPPSPTCVINP